MTRPPAVTVRAFARRLPWWAMDYVYAGSRQVRSVLGHRPPPAYASGVAGRPAILVLPGVYETWRFLEPLATQLHADGFAVFTVPELGVNRRSIPDSARLVQAALERLATEYGITDVIILAHSKGGLIGKSVMLDAELSGDLGEVSSTGAPQTAAVRILGMVAVATPFAGSAYARFMPSSTLRAFSPRDAVLMGLGARRQVDERIVSIYAAFDPHIPESSILPGAHNVELPVAGHFLVLANPRVRAAVIDAVVGLANQPRS